MNSCKWRYPELEEDHSVHFKFNAEVTLCGLYYEGQCSMITPIQRGQNLIHTKEKVNCDKCIEFVEACKKVKRSQYE